MENNRIPVADKHLGDSVAHGSGAHNADEADLQAFPPTGLIAGPACCVSLSTASAIALPPPRQSAAIPRRASRRSISYRRSTRMRVPEAPIGCPNATAPPFTLVLLGSRPS